MKRRGFQRLQPPRSLGSRFLIACEGTETEPNYFRDILSDLKVRRERLIIAPHLGPHPKSVVKAAVQMRNNLRLAGDWSEEDDQAWAVFDCDEHRQQSRKRWNEAVETAGQQNIALVVSNPSFELWYLLHYQDQFTSLKRGEAESLLRIEGRLPRYDKPDHVHPNPLKGRTEKAIERAQQLESRSQIWGPYTNPSTGVWKLVNSLLAL